MFRVLFICFILIASCSREYHYKDYELDIKNSEDVFLEFYSNRYTLQANGIDTTLLTVIVPLKAEELTKLQFTTRIGSFTDDKKVLSVDVKEVFINDKLRRAAQTVLTSPSSVDTNLIIVQFEEWSDSITVRTEKVYPTSLQLSVNKALALPFFDDPIMITGRLRNGNSPVTNDHETRVLVVDTLGNDATKLDGIDLLSNDSPKTSTGGVFTIQYIAGETSYEGILHIIGNTLKEDGAIETDTASIIVSPNTSDH